MMDGGYSNPKRNLQQYVILVIKTMLSYNPTTENGFRPKRSMIYSKSTMSRVNLISYLLILISTTTGSGKLLILSVFHLVL